MEFAVEGSTLLTEEWEFSVAHPSNPLVAGLIPREDSLFTWVTLIENFPHPPGELLFGVFCRVPKEPGIGWLQIYMDFLRPMPHEDEESQTSAPVRYKWERRARPHGIVSGFGEYF